MIPSVVALFTNAWASGMNLGKGSPGSLMYVLSSDGSLWASLTYASLFWMTIPPPLSAVFKMKSVLWVRALRHALSDTENYDYV